MPSPVPTPPEKVLNRVLLVSAIDGWCVVTLAGFGLLIALALGDLSGAFTGLLIIAAGIMELTGRRRLLRGDPLGMKRLVRAQLFLLTVILLYCVTRLGSFDLELAMSNLTPEMEAVLKENGVERADVGPLVQILFYLVYGLVAFLSLLFQGGLILYYRSRAARVAAALVPPPPIPPQSPLA